jgi:predicted amidohydrolase
MARTLSIAACQFELRPVRSFADFAAQVRAMLDDARGAELVVFPELFTLALATAIPGWRDAPIAELPRIDRFTEDYRALFAAEARERGQTILAGSHLVLREDRPFNVAHLFEPGGRVVEHAKTHVFPAELAWKSAEGDRLTTAGVGPARAGIWRVRHCVQARAVENQIYAVHCCTVGSPAAPLPGGFGRSSIVSPCDAPWPANGVLAEAEASRACVVRAEIDLDALHGNRETGAAPTFRDRRRRAALYPRWPSHAGARGGES